MTTTDRGPEEGGDAFHLCPGRHHGVDGPRHDTEFGTHPSGVSTGNNPGRGIGEQHRNTVGRQHRQRYTRFGGHQRVGLRNG
ncbi:Uncharacterised protein [Mycobacteroides abscessus subsp. abscessus]|nr:Uncharacterised protein [Mycobacteroides abscessus subsp. abscessus]